jgi:gamma-D-glutamyl-L-lysine dipeptidyl-peptidase
MKRNETAPAAAAAIALFLLAACAPAATTSAAPAPTDGNGVPGFVADSIAAIRADYAPDRRVARFDIEAVASGEEVVLQGTTDQPAALARLARGLEARGLNVRDQVRRLPEPTVGDRGWALVNNSVANLRSEPRHAAELATQAPLGTPLRVLDVDGGWLLVQAPDGYLAWVDGGGVQRVQERDIQARATADKVIYLEAAGHAWSEPRVGSLPVSDLVAGALLVRVGSGQGFHQVRFPDGREAFVREGEAARYGEWVAGVRATDSSLVASAMTLLGRPYLWGGTSPNGMDCSGFTKTVFLLNGLLLPRDASQQIHAGALVDDAREFRSLRPGDLLFFGQPATASSAERVVHVGMWIGDGRFIHSSGRVLIGSVDPDDPLFDAYNTGRYLRTKRMLGDVDGVHRLADGALYPRHGRFAPSATAGPALR